MSQTGKIIRILANFYYVKDNENKIWECFARARLLKEGKLLLAGDTVEIEISGNQGIIVNLHERKNRIQRPSSANIDQVLVVFSILEPKLDFYTLDRYLSFVRYELPDEEITICINKVDLKRSNIDSIYEKCGFNIRYVSALTMEGLNELKECFFNKITLFTGPSGVGKSSLIKAITNRKDIEIGSLSAIQTGKHITRNIELIPLTDVSNHTYLIDTPGFSQIDFKGLNTYEIQRTFPEFTNTGCNFPDCLHMGEPGCTMPGNECSRYKSYIEIIREAKSKIIYSTKKESNIKVHGGKGKGRYIPKIKKKLREKSRRVQKQKLENSEDENVS